MKDDWEKTDIVLSLMRLKPKDSIDLGSEDLV